MSNQRYRLSEKQLDQYFDRVSLPVPQRIHDVTALSHDQQLAYLALLQKHQLVKVPWENLTQHYSWHRTVNVRPYHVFDKIVNNPGRGGYCFEANCFFFTILHSLNFQVYMAGSRIYHGREANCYGGFSHVVNIVTINYAQYLLDGGYGPAGPTVPFPVRPGDRIHDQIPPAQMRVRYDNIPDNISTTQRLWIVEGRVAPTDEFEPRYCFTDLEFTPADVEALNLHPATSPRTFFTHKVVAVRFTLDTEDPETIRGSPSEDQFAQGEIDGSISINGDTMRWRKKGKKIVQLRFATEKDRLNALEKYFGIRFERDEDWMGIEGTAAAVGAGGAGPPVELY